jgi:hypothetical protein
LRKEIYTKHFFQPERIFVESIPDEHGRAVVGGLRRQLVFSDQQMNAGFELQRL